MAGHSRKRAAQPPHRTDAGDVGSQISAGIITPMPKPFASSADLAEKQATLEHLADGVVAYTAEGDPNVGAVIGTDAILAIEARATPLMAQRWIDVLRSDVSDLPFGDLVLTHYHAVRTLGASAFGARRILAHVNTRALIDERGAEDWTSEQGRMPRLFTGAETIYMFACRKPKTPKELTFIPGKGLHGTCK